MRPYKFIMLSMSLAVLGMTSCSDFLDHDPDERNHLADIDQVRQLLISSYPSSNYGWVCELSSDNIIDNNAPHLPASSQSEQVVAHYNLSSERVDDEIFSFQPGKSSNGTDTPYNIWSGFYGSVASVNNALQALDRLRKEKSDAGETLTETEERQFKAAEGEARLIRAYDHFILVNIFSQAYKDDELSKQDIGVPYVTEPETKPNAKYERGNVTEVYQKIEEDLTKGLELIGNASFASPKYHFNVNAAHAFAARFYLFKRDYDKVIEHANAVLGTDDAATLAKMMKYDDRFEKLYYSSDFANVFQDPNDNNNIFLLDTYSTYARKAIEGRYSMNSLAAREIFYHNSPLWSGWRVNPTVILSGMFGNAEYGYYIGKVAEQFQTTDKQGRTGYAHTFRREFTNSELVLERAEAKIMKDDLAGAFNDLLLYDKSLTSYSSQSMSSYFTNNRMKHLTEDIINTWFGTYGNPNTFRDWTFTQRISPNFIVPGDATAYMNCLNYFRRFETVCDGNRFFDLKRWGIEYSHFIGIENTEYKMTWNDPRRAIEVPETAISAGLESSRVSRTDSLSPSVRNIDNFLMK